MFRVFAVCGAGVFVAAVGALHAIRRDISPWERGISRYADGRTRSLATIAFLSLAVSQLALARVGPLAAEPWLISGAGGLVLVAMTPVGLSAVSRTVGMLHTLGAMMFYVAIAGAMLASNGASGIAIAYVAAIVAFFMSAGVPQLRWVTGALQRLVFLLAIAWIARIAVG